MGGENTSDIMQRGIGGAQIAGGAVASYFGAPEIGVPLMVNGVKTEIDPIRQRARFKQDWVVQ